MENKTDKYETRLMYHHVFAWGCAILAYLIIDRSKLLAGMEASGRISLETLLGAILITLGFIMGIGGLSCIIGIASYVLCEKIKPFITNNKFKWLKITGLFFLVYVFVLFYWGVI